jgi:hypothetical protein
MIGLFCNNCSSKQDVSKWKEKEDILQCETANQDIMKVFQISVFVKRNLRKETNTNLRQWYAETLNPA